MKSWLPGFLLLFKLKWTLIFLLCKRPPTYWKAILSQLVFTCGIILQTWEFNSCFFYAKNPEVYLHSKLLLYQMKKLPLVLTQSTLSISLFRDGSLLADNRLGVAPDNNSPPPWGRGVSVGAVEKIDRFKFAGAESFKKHHTGAHPAVTNIMDRRLICLFLSQPRWYVTPLFCPKVSLRLAD